MKPIWKPAYDAPLEKAANRGQKPYYRNGKLVRGHGEQDGANKPARVFSNIDDAGRIENYHVKNLQSGFRRYELKIDDKKNGIKGVISIRGHSDEHKNPRWHATMQNDEGHVTHSFGFGNRTNPVDVIFDIKSHFGI